MHHMSIITLIKLTKKSKNAILIFPLLHAPHAITHMYRKKLNETEEQILKLKKLSGEITTKVRIMMISWTH